MSTVAIIQARMGSSRLPGKVLAEAAGKPLLAHMVERVRRSRVGEIIIACPNTPENWPIVNLAEVLGVNCFRGSENDVLGRVLGAAEAFGVELIVELTADCPLIDPWIIDEAILVYVVSLAQTERYLDLVSTSRDSLLPGNRPRAYPRGMDVRVFPTVVLAEINRLTADPVDHEHVSSYMWEHRQRFSCQDLVAPEWLRDDVRLTVDTPEDLRLVRAIFETLYPANPGFGLTEILALLAVRPDLRALNAHVQQKGVR